MTVQRLAGARWLLRALLLAATVLLLTVLWSSTAAHAAPDGPSQDHSTWGDLPTVVPVASVQAAPAGDVPVVADDPVVVLADEGEPAFADGPVVVLTHENVLTHEVAPAFADEPVVVLADEVVPVVEDPVVVLADEVVPVVVEDTAVVLADELPPAAAPSTDRVAPVVPAVEVVSPPATPTLVPSVLSAVGVLAPVASVLPLVPEVRVPEAVDALGPAVDFARPPNRPLVDAPHGPVAEHRRTASAVADPAAAVAVAVADQVPCPVVAPPSVATARPAASWSRPYAGGGSHREDRAPVAVSAASVENARGSSTRDDGTATWGGPADLRQGVVPTDGRARPSGSLPAVVEPPQLRVLSSRAGPGPAPAPRVEGPDSPA